MGRDLSPLGRPAIRRQEAFPGGRPPPFPAFDQGSDSRTMFSQDRDSMRLFLLDTWRKAREGAPWNPWSGKSPRWWKATRNTTVC